MDKQDLIDYDRIALAIEYLQKNFKRQPDLEEVAENSHLSPFHFQRLFTEWAGVSPKKFLQYISTTYAKSLIKNKRLNLGEIAFEPGLSGSGRLHDLFIHIEGMTPGEFREGGNGLKINYHYAESRFGKVLIGATSNGICHMSFHDLENEGIQDLKSSFPKAQFYADSNDFHLDALSVFNQDWNNSKQLKLHIRGSEFQLKVWGALLSIPEGNLTTYGEIAQKVGNPQASRAVGSAIGSNPVAYLIPCHRVIQSSGLLGGYKWGMTRKTALIGWEMARTN